MKQMTKRLFSALCAVAACSALAVGAGAAPNRERTSNNRILVIGGGSASCGLNGLPGQAGGGWDPQSMIERWCEQKGSCPLPSVCGRPECPDRPAEPDEPVIPDNPDAPDVPAPEAPPVPEVPDDAEDAPPAHETSSFAREVVRLVNQERVKAGLGELKASGSVQRAAQTRAEEQELSFSHTRPDGSSCFTALSEAGASYDYAGENIAYGQKTPADVMDGWMKSSGHRANILGEDFTQIGVGFHKGSNGTYYWTQMFTG